MGLGDSELALERPLEFEILEGSNNSSELILETLSGVFEVFNCNSSPSFLATIFIKLLLLLQNNGSNGDVDNSIKTAYFC